ncbi:MAG: hypothetical protein GJV46_07735 [Geobacter sp.]|nr:hypothetical protein [Geobacter sp.]
MNDLEQYTRYFSAGFKVGVGIPLPNAEVFRDWAIIFKIDEDLVTLQLSRDVLPVGVKLRYGQILELRGGKEGSGYSCRAIIVSEGDSHELLLRLIGEIVSDELREYYRIDAFLPIKYYVSREQNIETLRHQWELRRAHRLQMELEQKERSWNSALLSQNADLPNEKIQGDRELETVEGGTDSWETIIPLAANVSGGGLRLITHQGFENGEYVLLEILVPSPRRVVDVIARVIFANRNHAAGNDQDYFNTGMQFVYIGERERDAIVNHISTIQLKRIRQMRERYLFRSGDLGSESTVSGIFKFKSLIKWAMAALIVSLISVTLIEYFWRYAHNRPKGEIETIFEDAVQKYKDKIQK